LKQGALGVAFSCEFVRLDEAESASGPQNAAHYSDFLQGIKKGLGTKSALFAGH